MNRPRPKLIAAIIVILLCILAVPMLQEMNDNNLQAAPMKNFEPAKSAEAFVDSIGVVTH